jgi:hypothetical protein
MLKKQHIRPDLYNNFIMEIQDKTKDELITELNELLKKTNYLKVQNETLTAELLVANEKLFFQKKSASLLIIQQGFFRNKEKENRANELIISNKKLLFKMKKRKALS